MDYFLNDKKTFLAKLDKSKKGDIDERILPLIKIINSKPNYYTTSSCSGRVYFWRGSGKKNENEWINVHHELIDASFFELEDKSGLIWLRLEPMILHIACKDLDSANLLLEKIRILYKKSCILSASHKIIIEIRGSEMIEMPFYENGKLLFNGERDWLIGLINEKMSKIWKGIEKLEKEIISLS